MEIIYTPSDLIVIFCLVSTAVLAILGVGTMIALCVVEFLDDQKESARILADQSLKTRFDRLHLKEANDRAEWLRIRATCNE